MTRLICFLHTHSIHQKLQKYKLRNKVSGQNLCVTRWERTSRTESVQYEDLWSIGTLPIETSLDP